MKITVKAPAKINLSLDVLGKRPDGYHEISTVMQAVSLYDTVTVTDNDSGEVTVFCGYEGVPNDESNIAVKAALRFFDYCKMPKKGVHIEIDKQIPTQAGLAGGSSDGAAVIFALNQLFSAHLNPADMNAIAERVGADVPFCVQGGTKLCTGIGATLKKLPSLSCSDIVICKPDAVSVSTAEAYKKVDALAPHPCYTDEMVKAIYSRDMFMITSTIFNDFELALQIPEVNEIKSVMLKNKAKGAGMSGSGSAVFAVFTSSNKAQKCCDELKEKYPQTFLCKPVNIGCEVVENE
jgi:4-diphosphocytidyl-2-C-methyl-D-erythritol kinase